MQAAAADFLVQVAAAVEEAVVLLLQGLVAAVAVLVVVVVDFLEGWLVVVAAPALLRLGQGFVGLTQKLFWEVVAVAAVGQKVPVDSLEFGEAGREGSAGLGFVLV